MFESFIRIRTRFEGFHYWENAPDEVGFLRNPHRHEFQVTVKIQVSDLDRELEFFIVKRQLNTWIRFNPIALNQSCEMYADKILKEFILSADEGIAPACKSASVTVSEDGENDGVVEWSLHHYE